MVASALELLVEDISGLTGTTGCVRRGWRSWESDLQRPVDISRWYAPSGPPCSSGVLLPRDLLHAAGGEIQVPVSRLQASRSPMMAAKSGTACGARLGNAARSASQSGAGKCTWMPSLAAWPSDAMAAATAPNLDRACSQNRKLLCVRVWVNSNLQPGLGSLGLRQRLGKLTSAMAMTRRTSQNYENCLLSFKLGRPAALRAARLCSKRVKERLNILHETLLNLFVRPCANLRLH